MSYERTNVEYAGRHVPVDIASSVWIIEENIRPELPAHVHSYSEGRNLMRQAYALPMGRCLSCMNRENHKGERITRNSASQHLYRADWGEIAVRHQRMPHGNNMSWLYMKRPPAREYPRSVSDCRRGGRYFVPASSYSGLRWRDSWGAGNERGASSGNPAERLDISLAVIYFSSSMSPLSTEVCFAMSVVA